MAQSPAFDPLQPSQPLDRSLRVRPQEDSSILRELKDTDRIRILRSNEDWFEVDVLTDSELPFRGWVKGGLPTEKQAGELPPIAEEKKRKSLKPLTSKSFKWLWLDQLEKRPEFSLLAGYDNLKFSSTGLQNIGSTPTRLSAPGYSLGGFNISLNANLPIMEALIANRTLTTGIGLDYSFGLFSVTFGSGMINEQTTIPAELEGVGYSVKTHNLKALVTNDWKILKQKKYSLSFGVAPGFMFFESSPDLRKTNAGNIVFTQIQSSGVLTMLNLKTTVVDRFHIEVYGSPLFLSSFKEETGDPSEKSFKAKSIPLLYGLNLGYQVSSGWGAILNAESFSASLKKSGISTRINETYEDLEAKLSYLKIRLGLRFLF